MKKTLAIAVLFVMLAALTLTGVKAVVASTLVDELYDKLDSFGMTAADKKKAETYLKDVTDAEAEVIMGKVDYAISIAKAAGVESYKDLPKIEGQDRVNFIQAVKDAASVVDVTVAIKDGKVSFEDTKGNVILAFEVNKSGELAYTGSNNVVVAVSAVAVIALAAVVVVRTKIGA